jgi:putative ABC transport system permease protein
MNHGIRTLGRDPAFAATIVVVLSVGIGATSAIFSTVQATLVRTLPFPDPSRLVKIGTTPPAPSRSATLPVSPADFIDWRDGNAAFDALAAYQGRISDLTGQGRPVALDAVAASSDLFRVLRVRPLLGRAFVPEDDWPGAAPVAILSYGLWRTRFAADRGILGREIALDGEQYVIVGVMGDLRCPVWGPTAAQIWIPLAWT